jgi:hypothetical protein
MGERQLVHMFVCLRGYAVLRHKPGFRVDEQALTLHNLVVDLAGHSPYKCSQWVQSPGEFHVVPSYDR